MSTNPEKPAEESEVKKDNAEPAAPGEIPAKEEDSTTFPASSNTAAESESLLGYKAPEMLKNLPSQLESRRSEASKRFSKAMDDLQTAMFTAGRKLNDMTGYSEIEQLKKSIQQQETNVRNCRLGVQTAKESYQSAISRRSASQREVNELLQRKHAWSTTDLERFTSLYRSDHANEQAELAASEQLAEAERTLDEAQTQLSRSILARYHEEQIWSDKIRRASTWGTWGLMGFNVLLFIIVQLGLEPWKRRRLVGGFEDKVREVIQEENMRQALMRAPLVEEEKALAAAAAAATPSAIQSPQDVATQTATEAALAEAAVGEETLPEAETPATQADLEDVGTAVEEVEPVEMIPLHWLDPNTWIPGLMQRGQFVYGDTKKEVKNLFSDETVIITKNEMTLNSLQCVMLGAFVSALITLLWGRS